MDPSEWTQKVADARIARQLETADAIDAKGGVLFAYSGAVLVAAPTLAATPPGWQMWATLALGGVAIVATAVLLWPWLYSDPPDARKLERNVRDQDEEQARHVLEALIDQQLDAIDSNECLMMFKAWALRVAVVFAGLATLTLAWQVFAERAT